MKSNEFQWPDKLSKVVSKEASSATSSSNNKSDPTEAARGARRDPNASP